MTSVGPFVLECAFGRPTSESDPTDRSAISACDIERRLRHLTQPINPADDPDLQALLRELSQLLTTTNAERWPPSCIIPEMDAGWEVAPGQTLTRGEIHDRYGGGRRGGMEPSGQTPNVLLFSKPEAGLAFGYTFDGWREDGTYHYTGEGQSGDQVFTHGNRAALLHVEQGRALRLFESSGTQATYVGEFRLADPAFYRADGLDIDGLIRSLIVFRLQPMGDAVSVSTVFIENGEVEAIPLEALDVEAFIVQHPDEPALAVRREAQLVARYVAELHRAGIATCRQSIPMTGGAKLFTDLYDLSRNELIEAKASAARASLRLGLGQILDYARFVGHESKSLLVPVEPPADMLDLLASYGVGCIWETPSGFVRFP